MAPAERRAPSRIPGREAEYARAVGQRLRAVRAARGWSLQDVAEVSGGRFKSSVIGSYERASRYISVPRLHSLAEFYGVPLSRLLPLETETAGHRVGASTGGETSTDELAQREVTVDLRALEAAHGAEFVPLQRYIESITVQRGGIATPMVSVRAGDVSALAAASRVDPQTFVKRLREAGLVNAAPGAEGERSHGAW